LEHDRENGVRGRGGLSGRMRHEVIDSEAKTTMGKTRKPAAGSRDVDLLVVGGGVAGLFGALCAASEGDVLVLSKGPLLASTSSLAQGGIAAAVGEGDTPALHAEDTLRTGRGLSRPRAVSVLTEEAPARIRDLVDLGVEFDEGLGLEGGHSQRRVVHAGGAATGDRVARKLAERVLAHPRIRVVEGARMTALWTAGGRCVGAATDRGPVRARSTLLATGGASALWKRTTNPPGTVGEGIAAAYRVGAAVADLEFTQFHPTTLVDSTLLLSEALRGEGAVLLDEDGRRFTDELAPRDVVAREIAARGTALLDLRSIDRGRFPTLMGSLLDRGYDPAASPIPVAPAAHYTVGGIITDLDGRSEVPGLYAAGECAATGVHGANRLASNSLLECLVFGRRAAHAALDDSTPASPAADASPSGQDPEPVTDALRNTLWADCGLVRDAAGLERLLAAPHLLVRLIAESALLREESRGSHFRADFPATSEAFERHVVLRPGSEPTLETWR
jgi:L-aspartate oxidase